MSGGLRLVFDTCPEPIPWHTHSLARRLPSPQLLVKPALSRVPAFLQAYLEARVLFLQEPFTFACVAGSPGPENQSLLRVALIDGCAGLSARYSR
jgi:hypothetical protein